MIARTLSLLLLCPVARADEGGTWSPRASMNVARQEVAAARIGDKVYVAGGFLAGLAITPTAEVYDTALDRWSLIAPMFAPRDHAAAAAAGGKFYVIGGFAGDFSAKADVWRYDPAADSWTAVAPLPVPRGAGAAVELGGKLYHFGGTGPGGSATKTTLIYDPALDAWSQGADMPTAREHLNAVVFDDSIYVLGGRRGGFASLDANERYLPSTDQWQVLAPMPTARSAMASAAFRGRIVVAGGEVPVLFDDNEVYDPATNAWHCQAPMPIPRHGAGAVALDDGILFAAGGLVQGLGPTTATDVFEPASLDASPPSLSLAAGGAHAFTLHGGSDFAGDLYIVAGTASGPSPGFVQSGVAVPLNPDAYFLFTQTHASQPPFGATFGVLDGAGTAAASLTLPPGTDPALAGLTLHHAWVRLDLAVPGFLAFASNAAPLELLP